MSLRNAPPCRNAKVKIVRSFPVRHRSPSPMLAPQKWLSCCEAPPV